MRHVLCVNSVFLQSAKLYHCLTDYTSALHLATHLNWFSYFFCLFEMYENICLLG